MESRIQDIGVFAAIGGALLALACTCATPGPPSAQAAPLTSPRRPQFVNHSADLSRTPGTPANQHPRALAAPAPVEPSPAREEFPAKLVLHQPQELAIKGDRTLRVTHAAASQEHAIIYLHGMCGNSKGADPWADVAAARGTLIVLRANVPCGDRPGYKWPKELGNIQERIKQALERVKEERAGWLDVNHPSIIGYSQGAYRAEQLVGAYPGFYSRALMGGPPTEPDYDALHSLPAVAVLGGELEDHAHMLRGTEEIASRGVNARFFLLPRVHHGSYGPEGRRVVGEALDFLFTAPDSEGRPAAPTSHVGPPATARTAQANSSHGSTEPAAGSSDRSSNVMQGSQDERQRPR